MIAQHGFTRRCNGWKFGAPSLTGVFKTEIITGRTSKTERSVGPQKNLPATMAITTGRLVPGMGVRAWSMGRLSRF